MTLRIRSFTRSSRIVRRTVATLVAAQVMGTTPVLAEAVAERTYSTARFSWSGLEMAREWTTQRGHHVTRILRQQIADFQASNVRVNRTVPTVTAPALSTTFSETPTTDEIKAARFFTEPLVPLGAEPSEAENVAIGRALEAFVARANREDASALLAYLDAYPATPWRASLVANIATLYARNGYFSRASALWEQAWNLAKTASDPAGQAVADFAVAHWLQQATVFGQVERLQARLAEIGERDIRGPAGALVTAAREGLDFLMKHHDKATFSGPEAVKALAASRGVDRPDVLERIRTYRSPHEGTPLADVHRLAVDAGLTVRMLYATRVTDIPVPSIVHLRSEHFSALVARTGDRILVRDPAFGKEAWFSEAALRDEASGYFLVPDTSAL